MDKFDIGTMILYCLLVSYYTELIPISFGSGAVNKIGHYVLTMYCIYYQIILIQTSE